MRQERVFEKSGDFRKRFSKIFENAWTGVVREKRVRARGREYRYGYLLLPEELIGREVLVVPTDVFENSECFSKVFENSFRKHRPRERPSPAGEARKASKRQVAYLRDLVRRYCELSGASLEGELRGILEDYGVRRLEELSRDQASALIDFYRGEVARLEESGGGSGGDGGLSEAEWRILAENFVFKGGGLYKCIECGAELRGEQAALGHYREKHR